MKIALIGNPNTGKSTVFNLLTGLRQKVGNFPGVTVDRKSGMISIQGANHELIDIPGVYSIYPSNKEEKVVYDLLVSSPKHERPDLGIVVADASNLSRSLFLFSQLIDCGLPLVLVINMNDIAEKKGISIDIERLKETYKNTPIVVMNARVGLGKDRLMKAICSRIEQPKLEPFNVSNPLKALDDLSGQEAEAAIRHKINQTLILECVKVTETRRRSNTLDRWLTHPIFGYFIFAAVLFVIFQFVFSFASFPMHLIEIGFEKLTHSINSAMPKGPLSALICEGIIPGISGVLVFIPQIGILFFFIALLEDSGYLARAVFLMDRLVRPFGLNGRSVVPLLSSMACAIPGVMATRGIPNYKERIITIFVAPLMSCSARIPVFTLLIGLVIPNMKLLGFIQLQGVVLLGFYVLGIISALFIAWIMQLLIKQEKRSYYLMEIPEFKRPLWRNIFLAVFEKIKVFTTEAGGIILAISIVLWALASYGPATQRHTAIQTLKKTNEYRHKSVQDQESMVNAVLLENSYIGIVGKGIEPVIKPIGYDWKIGIALITSFAAREVFVGSLSTIYANGGTGSSNRLSERLKKQKNSDGTLVFSMRTGISLMVFYVYAMQCLSTLAIVKRETKSWKWPIIQLVVFGFLAYFGGWICYNLF
ncbi:MAG: ferrous iron transporter B [Flavobacteriales bacterium]